MPELWMMPTGTGHRQVDKADILSGAGFFIAAILAGLWGYFGRPAKKETDPIVASFGIGWMEREQTQMFLSAIERSARAQERIADALEVLADKRQDNMEDSLEEMAKKIDKLLFNR